MVRLLSMGTSRVRESFAHATRGTIFSENKFGIRHFGTILYEPLTETERNKNAGIRNAYADGLTSIGKGNGLTGGSGAVLGILNPLGNNSSGTGFGLGPEVRIPVVGMMQTLWSNFATQTDLELFKRNIYPGNGTGVAQFLGGDLGDGWADAASLTPEDIPNPRLEYLNRLTDSSWNNMLQKYDQGNPSAAAALDSLTQGNQIRSSGGLAAGILSGSLLAAGAALAFGTGGIVLPTIGGLTAVSGGASLLGSLTGRGGVNIWKTFGLISDADDDMPGFDEVSFRAQTYMKSVWDLFQMCARLLPNYIVAVRPFEDRSTVFYGKPHWLYTSGVVPITTGFPSEKRAVELGLKTPSYRSPDSELMDILTKINKESTSTADYEAFKRFQNPAMLMEEIIRQQSTSGDVYGPAGVLSGKVINLTDPRRLQYMGYSVNNLRGMSADAAERWSSNKGSTKRIVSEIPTNKGFITIGYHLPIDPTGVSTEVELEKFAKDHREIPQMPLRYSFPFFTDRVAGAIQLDYAFYALSSSKKDGVKTLADGDKDVEKLGADTLYVNLLDTEASLVSSSTTSVSGNAVGDEFVIDLSAISFTSQIDPMTTFGSTNFIFNIEGSGTEAQKSLVRVPLPMTTNILRDVTKLEGSWEYEYIDQTKSGSSELSYRDWGSPKTALDEQFYIAMRWPYRITEDEKDPIFQKFKEEYFPGRKESEFYGTPADYKNRKVLVYSPITRTAVICKPAFFLWGEDQVDVNAIQQDIGRNRTDSSFVNFKTNTQEKTLSAIVSPDAAYYLGAMHLTEIEKAYFTDEDSGNPAVLKLAAVGLAPAPQVRECYFTFVDDSVPVGVVTTIINPAVDYELTNEGKTKDFFGDNQRVIGFGNFAAGESQNKLLAQLATDAAVFNPTGSADAMEGQIELYNERPSALNTQFDELVPVGGISLRGLNSLAEASARGGNILASSSTTKDSYFDLVLSEQYTSVGRKQLYDILDRELKTTGDEETGTGRLRFTPVYDPLSEQSRQARAFFDESFSANTHVIAGNGRTLSQANDIWDQFRFDYHEMESVKKIFFDAFGLDPGSEEKLPDFLIEIIRNPKATTEIFKAFSSGNTDAVDEFTLLLGSDFINSSGDNTPQRKGANKYKGMDNEVNNVSIKQAIEFARKNLVDASLDDGGLIKYFDTLVRTKYKRIGLFLQSQSNLSLIDGADINGGIIKIGEIIKDSFTSRQLFLLIVGMFRQAMWQEAYPRAWLVLKPNRKYTSRDMWDFGPVNKIFAAFIDPNSNYSSDKKKFLKLLADNKGEGNSAGNIVGVLGNNIDNFWDNNIGPIFTALSDGLSGLMQMFRMSMLQMGYGLGLIDNFAKQANIMNKALNDSIYYSLGRAGSLLRAIDNPFTREYGEPVVEIREPFQRIHYLSSFSTILANNIRETTVNVATQVTAVSDGKYPVTVALDKSIPSERQIEKTVETGLYYDNIAGEGLFGIAQPLFHPMEFARGAIKLSQGAPDELMARRVALAHLKESLKDIYSGELLVLGSPDIRPHDLVYLADVYERMYGIFEVEQVVHHFTPNMGFITSITPNALVSVNDPGRWFMSSWIHSWLSIQNIRNDTRSIINSVQAGNTGVLSGGNISMSGISQLLRTQMLGGIQFTHGSSALMKDVMSNFAAEGLTDAKAQIDLQVQQQADMGGSLTGIAASYIAVTGTAAIVGALLSPIAPVGAAIGAAVASAGFWSGWKWVRDNVLDQHGCYISYLNKNGQPMDAGLAINQGMVVGRYHTKRLLPGILGVKTKVTTVDGNAFIRNDDLLKSLGWKEKEITDLVRYVSYENALVNSEVLKYSGTGPDKAGLHQFFKVICKLNRIIDGDEIEVIDLLNPLGTPFKVRMEGVIASSLGVFEAYTNTSIQSGYKTDAPTTLVNIDSKGGKTAMFLSERLANKPFIIRVSPNDQSSTSTYTDDDFSAGSKINNPKSYFKAINYGENEREKTLGTIFYRLLQEDIDKQVAAMRAFFVDNSGNSIIVLKEKFIKTLDPDNIFYKKFTEIYNSIYASNMENYFKLLGLEDPLSGLTEQYIKLFNDLIHFRTIEVLYSKASEWPYISWDEYYDDGLPATLNWELVTNNLAQVYTVDLLRARPSQISLDDTIISPKYVPQTSGL